MTREIEAAGKHWVSELERSRLILWQGHWQRIDSVAEQLRSAHPESFQSKRVRCRNGETRDIWAFTKVVRLKKYGRKRVMIVCEQADLSGPASVKRNRGLALGQCPGVCHLELSMASGDLSRVFQAMGRL